MNKIIFYLPVFILICTSCGGGRAFPEEILLFPNDREEKWWLMNSILFSPDGSEKHTCLLLTDQPAGEEHYLSAFLSEWQGGIPTFGYSIRQTFQKVTFLKNNFPLYFQFPASDSTSQDWYFAMNRNKLKFEGGIKYEQTGMLPFISEACWKKQNPFPVERFLYDPEIGAVRPWQGWTKARQNGSTIRLHTAVFVDAQSLVEMARTSTIVWMDLYMDNGADVSILIKTDASGVPGVCKAMYWKNGTGIAKNDLLVTSDEKNTWHSPETGKKYPLTYTIQGLEDGQDYSINPHSFDQEVKAGKSAFWMGAVELLDEVSRIRKGAGNMYILNF